MVGRKELFEDVTLNDEPVIDLTINRLIMKLINRSCRWRTSVHVMFLFLFTARSTFFFLHGRFEHVGENLDSICRFLAADQSYIRSVETRHLLPCCNPEHLTEARSLIVKDAFTDSSGSVWTSSHSLLLQSDNLSIPSLHLSLVLVSAVIGQAGGLFHSSNHYCTPSLSPSLPLSVSLKPPSIFSIRSSLWLLSSLLTSWLRSLQEGVLSSI